MVALSVSISAITSPALTVSPSLTCHLARLPSLMVGDSAGIRMEIGMFRHSLRAVADRLGRLHDVLDLRPGQLLEIGGVGRSEEHTSELQSLMRISSAVFCLQK